jgi:GLPGLI family protein
MRYLYITLLVALSTPTLAQQGTVLYEEKIKLRVNVEGDVPEGMDLPKEHINQKILTFTGQSSIYVDVMGNQPAETETHSEGGVIKVRMDRPEEKTFIDLKNRKILEQRELMGRKFLVSSDLTGSDWKLTGNQKMIAGYPCQEALRMEGERNITAWFTPKIQVGSGPSRFAGLPGLVLECTVNAGEVIITAKEVKLNAVDEKLITPPDEGRKVTREEFEKIREEKMKEMREQNGGEGDVIIKIRK